MIFMLPGWGPHDFKVGVTLNAPDKVIPTPNNYALCVHYVHSGVIISLQCDSPDVVGRYLIIQVLGKTKQFMMCEVEVYGGKLAFPLHLIKIC